MTQIRFLGLVCAGAILYTFPATIAQAQAGGGKQPPGQNPSMQTPPTLPGQNPGLGGPNGPEAAPAKVDDKKFLKDAAMGGMTEVELGKLASQKATRDDVKQFAQRMVDDHSKANDQLKEVASKEGVSVPDSLDSKHQSRVDKLSKLSGEDFDKAYIKDQLKDHETDVREFNAEAQNGNDANVKSFASNTLPTQQQHLDAVKSLNKSEKKQAKM